MKTVKIISMATIAEIKAVKRGTEKHATIGTLMVVTEINAVPTFINIHMDQEENTPMRVAVKATPREEDPTPGSDTQEGDIKVKKEVKRDKIKKWINSGIKKYVKNSIKKWIKNAIRKPIKRSTF